MRDEVAKSSEVLVDCREGGEIYADPTIHFCRNQFICAVFFVDDHGDPARFRQPLLIRRFPVHGIRANLGFDQPANKLELLGRRESPRTRQVPPIGALSVFGDPKTRKRRPRTGPTEPDGL